MQKTCPFSSTIQMADFFFLTQCPFVWQLCPNQLSVNALEPSRPAQLPEYPALWRHGVCLLLHLMLPSFKLHPCFPSPLSPWYSDFIHTYWFQATNLPPWQYHYPIQSLQKCLSSWPGLWYSGPWPLQGGLKERCNLKTCYLFPYGRPF